MRNIEIKVKENKRFVAFACCVSDRARERVNRSERRSEEESRLHSNRVNSLRFVMLWLSEVHRSNDGEVGREERWMRDVNEKVIKSKTQWVTCTE